MDVDKVYAEGDIAWSLISTALVFLMIPGLGYFYSGISQSKNALSMIFLCCISAAIVFVQWFFVGYSLALSPTSSSKMIGNFDFALLRNVLGKPSSASDLIPEISFMLFQGMFACITPALAIGASAERGRIFPCLIFILLWSVFVYNFVCYWTWSKNGWAAKLGALDYAGGTPIHIASGISALVYSIVLGKRNGHGVQEFKPHNLSNVVLGTALLWFGWFGFNGGSSFGSNIRAVVSCVSTMLSSSVGGLTWLTIDYFSKEKKFCAYGFCSGVISGLVSITPAAGFVDMWSSLIFGFFGAVVCNLAVRIKDRLGYDDALDVFSVHGVGGFFGSILTGVFARKNIANLDPALTIKGGGIEGNWMQIVYQLCVSSACLGWAAIITLLILLFMNQFEFTKIRLDNKTEEQGVDISEFGTTAYGRSLSNLNSKY